ncbi:MAG: DUF4038 domain-containing protein, partial [Candidatus Acidiferrales bacterium]
EDKLAGSPGSYATTVSATGGWTMQMVALKPASSVVGGAPAITSATTASGKVGSAFSYQITATNTPTSYGATGLPAGLSVSTTTGLISGTPTAAGTSTVTLSATNGSGTGNATLTLTINPDPPPAPVITSATTASGTVGSAFSYQITATNTPTSYGATGLPGGLSVNTGTGSISGTPTAAGTSTVTLSATNGSGTGNATFTLTIGSAQGQLMALSSNGKYLVNTITGKPVFVIGDDAFDLATMLSSAQVTQYFSTRAGQGYNAAWVTTIDNGCSSPSQPGSESTPPKNYYGYSPFDGADFTNEDSNYWANVDSVVATANTYGITLFLQPFFVGSESFGCGYLASMLSASTATLQAYGTFLGERYANSPNIVWLLGGDSNPTTANLYSKVSILGAAIKAADPNHLMTMEPCEQCVAGVYNTVSGFSAAGVAVPSWLGINWGYPQLSSTITTANNTYTSSPFYPPLCGENYYELENSSTELTLRFEQYSEILSGCYVGRIFGNGAIWSFNSSSSVSSNCVNGNDSCRSGNPTWQSQLTSTGSLTQSYQGKLFSSREHWLLVPDTSHTVVTAGYGSGLTMTTAARTSDGQTIIAYIPNGNATSITVAMSKITSSTETVQGWWFNPSTAATTNLGTFPNSGTQSFTPPDSNDWVLVLDDASAGLPAPRASALPAR